MKWPHIQNLQINSNRRNCACYSFNSPISIGLSNAKIKYQTKEIATVYIHTIRDQLNL